MSQETPAYICSHVFKGTRPILLVSRVGGEWQFLCGAGHDEEETPNVVGLNHLFNRDPSLRELTELPSDWEAERMAVGSPWVRKQVEQDGG